MVVAVGNHAFDPLSKELMEGGFVAKVIGDAEKPGTVYDAVSAGHRAGMTV